MLRMVLGALSALTLPCWGSAAEGPIDRQALVTRHNPHLTKVDVWAPLSVGNGGFCFTVDVTGLQTFEGHYRREGIGLETQARWSWHSTSNPDGFRLADANRAFRERGREIGYPTEDRSAAGQWLRQNPHALPLALIALDLERAGGTALGPGDVSDIDQELDLWRGVITSRYTIEGQPVKVTTACAPDADLLAVRIESPLLRNGRLGARIAWPRGYEPTTKNNAALDWSHPESHETRVLDANSSGITLEHRRDEARQVLAVQFGRASCRRTGGHEFRLSAGEDGVLEFTLAFAPRSEAGGPEAAAPGEVRARSGRFWENFWRSGGAVDFTGSTDPRAAELERRVVLSQYLTAIQCAGDFPPSESGLTLSTWYQKHHTEMMWWHAAHFALWGREAYAGRTLDAFVRALPVARELARSRGLDGARWPKMVGPDWRESPGGNPLIVWNQPHPIHLAELLYRCEPTAATLARYGELVEETARAMATMLQWEPGKDGRAGRYNLGPPLWMAQEIHDPATSVNPCYELSYWAAGLGIAQQWRERLGRGREKEWDRKLAALAALPVKDGCYVALESHPDTWENVASRQDHPSFLMALGQLPGPGVDRATMARTLHAVLRSWDWEKKIWGWDYPMIAMTAARLGEPRVAVDVLLKSDSPNNSYTAAGHNRQRADLPLYLPGNGALLAAVAMMAAGWDGAPPGPAPGFPADGGWVVRWEGLHPLP